MPVDAHELRHIPPGRCRWSVGDEPSSIGHCGQLMLHDSRGIPVPEIAKWHEGSQRDARSRDHNPLARRGFVEKPAETTTNIKGADGLHGAIIALEEHPSRTGAIHDRNPRHFPRIRR